MGLKLISHLTEGIIEKIIASPSTNHYPCTRKTLTPVIVTHATIANTFRNRVEDEC